ncbi:MAG: LysM peptidoglycan-binding domain-containing protein [Aggregatilineales bacterium]
MMQRRTFVLLLTVLLALAAAPVAAQDGNLLQDPGFEGEYTGRGRPDLNIPAAWGLWFTETPRTESWMNLPPVAFPHNGPGPNPRSGARAFNFNKGFATFTAAIYQQVAVPAGATVTGSAFAYLRTCNIPEGFDNCGSSPESGAFTRVGIDPNGGTNPLAGSVVWSASAAPHDQWGQMTVSTTAAGGTVTLFLYTSQTWPSEINNVYWDDASLIASGGTGAPPAAGTTNDPAAPVPPPPPPPAEVGFVRPQPPRPDGSIVHVVQPGDTVDSIAVAYGVTRTELIELNNIRNPRLIQVGQELVIRPAEPALEGETPAASEQTQELEASGETLPDALVTEEETTVDSIDEEVDGETVEEMELEAVADLFEAVDDDEPAISMEDAPPAPVVSIASGTVLPAIDPAAGSAVICALLFNDINQNRLQEVGEPLLAGGTLALHAANSIIEVYETDGTREPYCFVELTPGDYTLSASAPDGYGMTTPDQLRVRALPGVNINLAFGAAQGFVLPPPPSLDEAAVATANEESAEAVTLAAGSPVTDNLGLIVLGAAGAVLVIGMGASLVLRQR